MAGKTPSVQTIFHLVFFSIYSVSLLWDFFVVVTPPGSRDDVCRKSTLGRIKYQSYINVIFFQWGYTALALVNDLVGTNVAQDSKKSFLQKFRDFMFSTISFPYGVGVLTFFWVGYFVDRESVYPADMDLWKPAIINHINHTLPGVVMLLELILVSHKMVKGYLKYIPVVAFVCGYFLMLSHFVIGQKIYIYPTSHEDTYFTLARSAIGESILMCVMIFIGGKLDSLIPGNFKGQKTAKKSQQKTKKDTKKKQQKKTKETKPEPTPKKDTKTKSQASDKQKKAPEPKKETKADPAKDKKTTKPQAAKDTKGQAAKTTQKTQPKKEQPKPQQPKKEQTKPQQPKKSAHPAAKKDQPKKQTTPQADNKVRQRKK